jgi:hypothetical protein
MDREIRARDMHSFRNKKMLTAKHQLTNINIDQCDYEVADYIEKEIKKEKRELLSAINNEYWSCCITSFQKFLRETIKEAESGH